MVRVPNPGVAVIYSIAYSPINTTSSIPETSTVVSRVAEYANTCRQTRSRCSPFARAVLRNGSSAYPSRSVPAPGAGTVFRFTAVGDSLVDALEPRG